MRRSIAAVLCRSASLGALALSAAAVLVLAGCGDSSGNGDHNGNNAAAQQSVSGSGAATPTAGAPTGSAPTGSSPSSSPAPTTSAPGSGSAAPTPGATPSRGTPADASTGARCHTSDLSASLSPQDAAAGNRYASLVLTNTSATTCRVYGYGGIKLVGDKPIPSRQHRDPSTPPKLLTVRPGAHVYSTLHWGAVTGTGDAQSGQCEPTATHLLVTPPDETTSLRIPWHYGPVCERGRIDQTAYRAGTGPTPPGD